MSLSTLSEKSNEIDLEKNLRVLILGQKWHIYLILGIVFPQKFKLELSPVCHQVQF